MAPCSSMAPYQPMSRQPSQRLQVAFIGGDFVRKGGDRLLSWQKEHLHSFVDLHIVTDDRFRDERIPNTLWYGSLGNSDVIGNLLPRMDVLCHPTTRDCSAIVVAEAAIVGVPSITTTVGGIPDLVEHGSTGYLFNSGEDAHFVESIIGLARNPELLMKLKVLARKKALAEFAAERVFSSIRAQVEHSLHPAAPTSMA
ncbi:glycosyltransferase [Verminephrobacter aporrectodeae subsp. tuberculatae]|nr:glycosyltransferase [Verminephrobacter aporrectodeae subsp. tuberculatae]